ncbi:MAG: AAA family ATPase [Candidatus Rokubacteria bacterium]|nr:AAA family ATPase [Candidatus Rokubacteria bacterium]
MPCPRCQAETPSDAQFCPECGAELTLVCARCGTANLSRHRFCKRCGQPLGTASAERPAAARFASPQSYTPQHLAEEILTSRTALEGERKQVTVLFADLKGSMELLADRDPEEARQLLDPVLERMMEAVHRYEGTVNQVMGDGIMALFGAPLAHEDHAVRACYAALRMQEAVKRHAETIQRTVGVPLQIRVGLNAGEVVVRSVGSDLHLDYTAVGQTTHLAARMEQMAMAGSILMTAGALRLAEGYVQVRPLGAIPVRGLSEAVEVYELTDAGPLRSRLQAAAARGLTRFVGRAAEIEQLSQALARARDGHGQVVAVVGEPGVGKSRLYWEFTHSHRTQGWLTLEAGSVSYGKATAFLPVIELLRAYFQIEPRDDARRVREKVTGKLLSLDRALEPGLSALLWLLDVPVDDPQWDRLDPPQRREKTLDAVKRLLIRESQIQPLLVLVEDLHWIDSETQALLDRLVESLPTARLLLLVNYRPEYQHAWSGKSYYRHHRIDPLPPESAEALLDALLGPDASLEPLKRLLIERTQGNPFFLEESARALIETKVLLGERGACRLREAPHDLQKSLQIPATAQAILAARIDRLAPDDKRLLQAAAVIGHDVPFPLLLAIAEGPEGVVRGSLARLQAAEFLYEARLFPDLEYTFKHALTLEVAYQGLLRERRRALHERVLQALEQQWAGREREKIELLAHHAVRGERWDRAARYLYQAGERAFARARYHAGAAFYQTTVEALDRLGDAADLTLKLDACLELWSARSTTGQYDGLGELGEKAEALARALDDGPRLAQVQLRQAGAVALSGVIRGTLQSAVEKAREALERADPRDLRTRSYAQFVVAHACRDLGRIGDAVREFGAGLALFAEVDRYGEEPGLVFPIYVSLSAWRSEAYAALGDFPQAFASAREALRVATDIQHPTSLAVANRYLGYVHSLRGEVETAVPFLERAVAIAREHDLFHATIFSSSHLAYALVLLGERERGLECLARALERSTGVSTPRWHHYGTGRASTYLAAGCLEEARAEIRQGLAAATERNAWGYRAPWLRLEAEVLAQGDPAGARERLEEALALAAELGMRLEVAHCHLGLGRLYGRTGDRPRTEEHLTAATTMYREMDMGFWLRQAERELGQAMP